MNALLTPDVAKMQLMCSNLLILKYIKRRVFPLRKILMTLSVESYPYSMKFILVFMAMEGTKMRIAVLSGKGGTGKTLVSVNLAAAAKISTYIDCDVEEPNGHLFFKPENIQEEEVHVRIPKVDGKLCNGCRKCVDFCKFNALAYIKDKLIIFEDICHSCGGCILLCPEKALTEKEKVIGKIQKELLIR